MPGGLQVATGHTAECPSYLGVTFKLTNLPSLFKTVFFFFLFNNKTFTLFGSVQQRKLDDIFSYFS